jgi:hypothetical protein
VFQQEGYGRSDGMDLLGGAVRIRHKINSTAKGPLMPLRECPIIGMTGELKQTTSSVSPADAAVGMTIFLSIAIGRVCDRDGGSWMVFRPSIALSIVGIIQEFPAGVSQTSRL